MLLILERLFFALLLVVTIQYVVSQYEYEYEYENEDEQERERLKDTGLFNEEYVERFENQFNNLIDLVYQQLLSKLGKIAMYMRLFRAWVRNPKTGQRGFDIHFPEPSIDFHSWVFDDCAENLTVCVEKTFTNIQNRSSILFPNQYQTFSDFTFDETLFTRSVTNTMFAYDVSVMYLMCFLTKNKLTLLKFLPFCTYGIEPHQKRTWPVERFLDAKNRPNLMYKNGIGLEPIDHFIDQLPFECADDSFCPDPCCGRRSGRSSIRESFCLKSICQENKYNEKINLSFLESLNNEPVSVNSLSEASHSCYLEPYFNDNFYSMTKNQWNLSCACLQSSENYEMLNYQNANNLTPSFYLDFTKIYRFDVRKCVDIDECLFTTCKNENEECVNTMGSYICVCALGYLRRNNTAPCELITFNTEGQWKDVFSLP